MCQIYTGLNRQVTFQLWCLRSLRCSDGHQVFRLVGSTGSNGNTYWSLVCLAWMGRWSRGSSQEPASSQEAQTILEHQPLKVSPVGKVSPPGFIHHFFHCLIISLLHVGASHHPNSFFPVAAAIEWFIEMGLRQSPRLLPNR